MMFYCVYCLIIRNNRRDSPSICMTIPHFLCYKISQRAAIINLLLLSSSATRDSLKRNFCIFQKQNPKYALFHCQYIHIRHDRLLLLNKKYALFSQCDFERKQEKTGAPVGTPACETLKNQSSLKLVSSSSPSLLHCR